MAAWARSNRANRQAAAAHLPQPPQRQIIMKTYTFSSVAMPTPRVRHLVKSSDGTQLAVQEWGNPGGKPIVFLHAFAMNHLFWQERLNDATLQKHRLITFDHRGHGESDKPLTPDAYNNGNIFADDLHAVITARQLVKPILVGWSMSGALMLDYVAKYGEANINGLVFVAAVTKLGGPMFAAGQIGATFGSPQAGGLFSEHLTDLFPAWNFVNRALTTAEQSREVQDLILGSAMLIPHAARTSIIPRDADHHPLLEKSKLPILAVHAVDDTIVTPATMEALKALRPDAQTHLWPTGGHAPQWENGAKFNAVLNGFAA
jgi:pimeloyl-ACP methyl ester carboxylesterase